MGIPQFQGWAAVRIESSLGSTWVTFIEPRQRMLHCTMPPWEHDVEKSWKIDASVPLTGLRAFGPVCPACQRSVLADEPSNGQHFPGGADSMESPRRGSFHGCGVLRPWTLASMLGGNGFGRLSELTVEQHFSMLRAQSNNAQLTARAYFKAAARVALKVGKGLKKPHTASTKPLSPRSPGSSPGMSTTNRSDFGAIFTV